MFFKNELLNRFQLLLQDPKLPAKCCQANPVAFLRIGNDLRVMAKRAYLMTAVVWFVY